MKSVQVLDCTLRDGGHHNLWHFQDDLVSSYLNCLVEARVNYCELGYRKPKTQKNLGEWAFCREKMINEIQVPENLNLGLMVDLKDFFNDKGKISLPLIFENFEEAQDSRLSFVRIAAHFHHLSFLPELLNPLRDLGYDVSVNLMRAGNISHSILVESLEGLASQFASQISVLTFADSFGSLKPRSTRELILLGKKIWPSLLGFHAHDNRQLALVNTFEAIEAGVDFVDSTVAGMGKGPGNTPTENLLYEISGKGGPYKSEALIPLLKDHFLPLKKELGWGSDYFYYKAADKGIHPDDVPFLHDKEQEK